MAKFLGISNSIMAGRKTKFIDLESVCYVNEDESKVYLKSCACEWVIVHKRTEMEEIISYVRENMWNKEEKI